MTKNSKGDEPLLHAVQMHERAVSGDKTAVKESYRLFQDMHNNEPQDALVKAYYGSSMSLLGRDAIDPLERVQFAVKGLKILDEALDEDKENIEILILRGYVNFQLPEMYFHRTRVAIDDFLQLISIYEKNDSGISKEFYWKILFDLGVAYHRIHKGDQAKETWKKLLLQTTETKYKKLIKLEGVNLADILPPHLLVDEEEDKIPPGVIEKYHKAQNGGKTKVEEALAYIEERLKEDPGNALLRAYYADCLSLTGKYATEVENMFSSGIQAMMNFDRAVNGNPEDLRIRYLRGYHSFRIPDQYFRRSNIALIDFQYIADHYDEGLSVLTKEQYCQLLFDLGCLHYRMKLEDEADKVWEKLIQNENAREFIPLIENEKGLLQKDEINNNKETDPLKEVKRLHNLGVQGNKEAVPLALALLEKYYQEQPENPIIKAYYGSCIALTGRDSTQTKNIFSNTIKGMVLINQSLETAPENLEIRLLRSYLTFALPEPFFELTGKTISDFQILIEAYETINSNPEILTKEIYEQLLFDLGIAHDRIGQAAEAKKVWEKLLSTTKNETLLRQVIERV